MAVYHCVPGRLPDLIKRFDTITLKLWEKHRIHQAGFWTTLVGESNQDLTYFLKWESLADPVVMVQQMWNHSSHMQDAFARRKIAWQELTTAQLNDMLAWLRSLPWAKSTSVWSWNGARDSSRTHRVRREALDRDRERDRRHHAQVHDAGDEKNRHESGATQRAVDARVLRARGGRLSRVALRKMRSIEPSSRFIALSPSTVRTQASASAAVGSVGSSVAKFRAAAIIASEASFTCTTSSNNRCPSIIASSSPSTSLHTPCGPLRRIAGPNRGSLPPPKKTACPVVTSATSRCCPGC